MSASSATTTPSDVDLLFERSDDFKDVDSGSSSEGAEEELSEQGVEENDGLQAKEVIENLSKIERALVKLLDISADAMDVFHDENDDNFASISSAYFGLLDFSLRSIVHTLTRSNTVDAMASVQHRLPASLLLEDQERILKAKERAISQFLS